MRSIVATLREIVLTEEKKPEVFADAQGLLDSEVKKKKGVSGLAVRAGYRLVKTFKRGFLKKVISDLMPEFCDALEPLHEKHLKMSKGSFSDYLQSHQEQVAEALLSVTDGKAEQSTNKTIKKTYHKLRGSAERNVKEAIPGLAVLLDKHYEGAV